MVEAPPREAPVESDEPFAPTPPAGEPFAPVPFDEEVSAPTPPDEPRELLVEGLPVPLRLRFMVEPAPFVLGAQLAVAVVWVESQRSCAAPVDPELFEAPDRAALWLCAYAGDTSATTAPPISNNLNFMILPPWWQEAEPAGRRLVLQLKTIYSHILIKC